MVKEKKIKLFEEEDPRWVRIVNWLIDNLPLISVGGFLREEGSKSPYEDREKNKLDQENLSS